jgi:hypothetical protein
VEAAIMKGLGAMAGVSDLIAVRPSLCQCGATKAEIYALELKTKDGRATAEQVEFIHRINDAGGYGAIAYGLDAALSCLEAWKLLLGKAS